MSKNPAVVVVLSDDEMRAILTKAGARFASVVFVKKDGSLRRMTYVNAKHRAHLMKHTERGDKAAITFAANNPDMLRVYDATKRDFRTVTLPRVICARVDGVQYVSNSYADARRDLKSRGQA